MTADFVAKIVAYLRDSYMRTRGVHRIRSRIQKSGLSGFFVGFEIFGFGVWFYNLVRISRQWR